MKKTYKEVWLERHPGIAFSHSNCRDIEFPELQRVNQNCGSRRCRECYDREYGSEDYDEEE